MIRTVRNISVRFIKNVLWWTGRLLSGIVPARRREHRRIVVARLDAIGDFVLFAPSLRALRELYRQDQISLLVDESVAPLAEACPYVDRLRAIDVRRYKRDVLYRFRVLVRIAAGGADVFLNPVYSREHFSDELALWSRAGTKIAWEPDQSNMSEEERARGARVYTQVVRVDDRGARHETDRNRHFLAHLGIPRDAYRLELWNARGGTEAAIALWKNHRLELRTVVALVPGAMHRFKSWEAGNFRILADRLARVRDDLSFVVIGSEADEGLVDGKNLGDRFIDLCGATRLGDLEAIFRRCALVIGNDTGPLHIAAAAGTPVVALVGGGHYGRFFPYPADLSTPGPLPDVVVHKMDCFDCNWRCIFEVEEGVPYPCVGRIDVETVLEGARSLIARRV